MKNKGSVFVGLFVLIVFLLFCYGCYLKLGEEADKIREMDKIQAEKHAQKKAQEYLNK